MGKRQQAYHFYPWLKNRWAGIGLKIIPEEPGIELVSPAYHAKGDRQRDDQAMGDLDQLGYPQGEIFIGDKFHHL